MLRVSGGEAGSGGRFVVGLLQFLSDEGVGVGEEGLGAVGVGVADGEVEAHGVGGGEASAGLRGYAGAAGADYVALDGGYVVGVLEGGADFGLTEARLQLLRQADADPDYGLVYVLAGDGFEDGDGRVVGLGGDIDVDGDEGAGLDGLEVEGSETLALGPRRVDLQYAEALGLGLFREVDALRAAGVDGHGIVAEDLVLVDVAEGHVVQRWVGDGGEEEDVVFSEHHGPLSADPGAGDGDVADEDGGDARLEVLELPGEVVGESLLETLGNLV